MLKRLTALVFILIVAGDALAGMPLHVCPPGCGAGGMSGMDAMECCRKAHEPPDAQGALAFKLCCADCAQPTPVVTAGSGVRLVTESYSVQQHPAAPPPRDHAPKATPDLYSFHLTPASSKSAYILHLALLI